MPDGLVLGRGATLRDRTEGNNVVSFVRFPHDILGIDESDHKLPRRVDAGWKLDPDRSIFAIADLERWQWHLVHDDVVFVEYRIRREIDTEHDLRRRLGARIDRRARAAKSASSGRWPIAFLGQALPRAGKARSGRTIRPWQC